MHLTKSFDKTFTRYSLSQMEKMVVVVSCACVYLYLENIYLKMINHYKRWKRHYYTRFALNQAGLKMFCL